MKKSLMVLSLAALALISNSAFAGETPRSTVQMFLNACKAGDVKNAMAQLIEGNKFNGEQPDATGLLAMRMLLHNSYITSVEKAGYWKAVVYVSIKDPMSGERTTYPITVKKVNGEWLIGK